MRKTLGMNRHQKAAHRRGEERLAAADVPALLEMSQSGDPEERLTAARYLCPCHVRRRVAPVWEALYRMLEDEDVRVRRAAWHTLEDGGRPDDPALDAITRRVLSTETDRQVLSLIEQVSHGRRERDKVEERRTQGAPARERGRCDFCGESNVLVEWATDTIIPSPTGDRVALICTRCSAPEKRLDPRR